MGPAPEFLFLDPMAQLILAMISAETRDWIALAAFERLIRHYPTWHRLIEAPTDRIARLIRPVTHGDRKAIHIKRTLHWIRQERKSFDLHFLGGMRVEQALHWLKRLPGVGPKIAATTLNFSVIHARCLPVDRHCQRFGYRFGLLRSATDFDKAHHDFDLLIPDRWTAGELDALHYYLKRHGQEVCTYRAPACGRCAVSDLCRRRGLTSGQ